MAIRQKITNNASSNNNFLLRKNAFSLVEVIIAMSILTALGYFMADLIVSQQQNISGSESRISDIEIFRQVQTLLTDKTACERTLAGNSTLTTPRAGVTLDINSSGGYDKKEFTAIRDQNDNIVFQKNSTYGNGSVQIVKFTIQNKSISYSGGLGDATLYISTKRLKGTLKNTVITKDILLRVNTNSSGVIQDCFTIEDAALKTMQREIATAILKMNGCTYDGDAVTCGPNSSILCSLSTANTCSTGWSKLDKANTKTFFPGTSYSYKQEQSLCCRSFLRRTRCKAGETGTFHTNGGGFIIDGLNIPSTTVVGPNAQICDSNVTIGGKVKVNGLAKIYGNASVFGKLNIRDESEIYGNARVQNNKNNKGNIFDYVDISNNVKIYGNANITTGNSRYASYLSGNAQIYGDAIITGTTQIGIKGNAKIYGNAYIKGSNSSEYGVYIYGDTEVYGQSRIDTSGYVSLYEQVKLYDRASITRRFIVVKGSSKIYGDAKINANGAWTRIENSNIYGNANLSSGQIQIKNSNIYGNADVSGDNDSYQRTAQIENSRIYGSARVGGRAIVKNANISGTARITGNTQIDGCTITSGTHHNKNYSIAAGNCPTSTP